MASPILALVAKPASPLLARTLAVAVPPFLELGWRAVLHPLALPAWREAGLPEGPLEVDADFGATGPVPELALSLGGDGTLLTAARLVGLRGTPLIGINLGSLGFLAAHPAEGAEAAVHAYLAGLLRPDRRAMLQAELWRNARTLVSQPVLNDAVLTKGTLSPLISFQLRVDGHDAAAFRADGLIVATPTGSTAYSLSAGGPILHPDLDAWVISPICPHSLTLRPSVVRGDHRVTISLEDTGEAHLTLDGQQVHPVETGDRVVLQRSDRTITLLQSPEHRFFHLLQEKLHWSTR